MVGLYRWSKTAASNASADPSVNWSEGQAPSSINDSGRAMMASAANYRDDISGVIVTTGTSAAYQVASNQVFDTLANFNGQMIAFTPHVTNAAGPVTLTIDGFANLNLRTSPGKELLAGTLIAGTPYTCTWNNTDNSLYLHGFYGNPYNVPLGAGMDYWFPTAPNSSFAFPVGQAISRVTYASFFTAVGTTFGVGDGSTTFNLPDKRGMVSAASDIMGGTARNIFTSIGTGLGAAGGEQTHLLNTPEIPSHNHALHDPSHTHQFPFQFQNNTAGGNIFNSVASGASGFVTTTSAATGITIDAAGGGAAHNNVQPTIVCNYILRII
jgi:microcystin-dependent protein